MSYVVFARKYRPMRFDDIVAQEHVTKTLQNAIKNDRIGSGYLFCGPRGTGKTTTARILAKALNCVNGPTPTPCGECSNCREITSGSSLDVLEIDAASNTGVDDIRTLRENVRYLPTSGKKRIYIIDEVHRLSGSAFDALLKTLEEPPPHVIFIFATTEPLKVPETILSRTQRFDFKRVSVNDLISHLKNIAGQANLNIEETALEIIARKADGSVRDALSLMDQIAAFAGDKVTEEDVTTALGLVEKKILFDFITAIASHDSKSALQIIRQVFEAGVEIKDFVADLMEHFRNLLILSTDAKLSSTLNFKEDELKEYLQQAEYYSVGDLIRLMKTGIDLTYNLKSGLDERLVLEMAAVKMAEMETTVRFEEILQAINKGQAITAGAKTDLFGSPEKKNDISPVKDSKKTQFGSYYDDTDADYLDVAAEIAQGSRTLNLPSVQAGWIKFLFLLQGKKQMLASHLRMGEIREIKNNEIKLVFDPSQENNIQVINKPENLNLITTALKEHFKTNLSIKFEIDPEKKLPQYEHKNNSYSKADVDRLVESSPRIKKLLEKVNGEIIGVRKTK